MSRLSTSYNLKKKILASRCQVPESILYTAQVHEAEGLFLYFTAIDLNDTLGL